MDERESIGLGRCSACGEYDVELTIRGYCFGCKKRIEDKLAEHRAVVHALESTEHLELDEVEGVAELCRSERDAKTKSA